MERINNKNVLAIGAHPDDMEQFAGGTLKMLANLGYKVTIAPLTSGECGSQTLSPAEIVAIRQKEAKRGTEILGAEYVCLEIADGCVEYNLETAKKVVKLIREVNPLIIFTHPKVDYMADHFHTGWLVLWAAPEATHKNFPVEIKAPHLEKQPYVYHTDPQGLIGEDGQIARANTIVDISEVIDEKLKAFSAHKSQMELLQKGRGIDAVEKTKRWAVTRGQQIRVEYGEGFCQQLLEQYPRDNKLAEILKDKVFIL